MRNELGSAAFKRENRAVRDAARPLSAVRDAKVLIERFDALIDLLGGRVSADCVAEFRAELGLEPTDDALHEWRKRAKDLRYVLELVRDVRPSMMRGLAH